MGMMQGFVEIQCVVIGCHGSCNIDKLLIRCLSYQTRAWSLEQSSQPLLCL